MVVLKKAVMVVVTSSTGIVRLVHGNGNNAVLMQLLPGMSLPIDPDTKYAQREPHRSSDGIDQGGDEPRLLHEPLNKP